MTELDAMRRDSVRRTSCSSGLFLLAGLSFAVGQQPASPAPCPTAAAAADTSWSWFPFTGLHLSLYLPAELRPQRYEALGKLARQAHNDHIPSQLDSAELVAAWLAPTKSPEPIHRVLLFTTRLDAAPAGRSCGFRVAGQPARIFRQVLSGGGKTPDEYWLEAYWPGFVLAVGGNGAIVHERAFSVLRGIAPFP